MLEIELFSYCNRTCNFCPNSYIDRHSENHLLDEDVFMNLIIELKEKKFNGFISFSRYNEPFSHKDILIERISQIKKLLPNIKLVTNTNGDFNTKGVEIDQITEMDYDGNKNIYISEDHSYRVMRLGNINNRAGALNVQSNIRNFPCYEPSFFVGVDYTGDIVPCCNIRHDIESHKPYILGNLKKNSLEEILNSKKAVDFRIAVADSQFPDVCKFCTKTKGRYTRKNGGIV